MDTTLKHQPATRFLLARHTLRTLHFLTIHSSTLLRRLKACYHSWRLPTLSIRSTSRPMRKTLNLCSIDQSRRHPPQDSAVPIVSRNRPVLKSGLHPPTPLQHPFPAAPTNRKTSSFWKNDSGTRWPPVDVARGRRIVSPVWRCS